MGYTNGFNTQKVIDALVGRLGWKQPTKAGSPVLNATNTASKSSRHFNDGSFHPLVTIENLKATIEDDAISDDDFNDLLEDLQSSIIMQCLTSVFNKPELIEQTRLFERSLKNDLLIANDDNFVGVRFKLSRNSLAVQINSLALFFNQDVTFPLYLYHDTKKDFLWTQIVTANANDQTIVIPDLELILNNDGLYKSGFFYLGYYQNDIGTAKAYYEQHIVGMNKTFGFNAEFFQAKRSGPDFNRINPGLPSYNFGLNAEVVSFWDHTDRIIRNAPLFDNAQGLQMAYHVLKQIIWSVRSNRNERILKDQADKYGLQYELDGKVPLSEIPKSSGLQDRIDLELVRLSKTFFPEPRAQTVDVC